MSNDVDDRWHKQYDDRKRADSAAFVTALLLIGALIVVGAVGAAFLYGDWKCLFIECRKIVP